MSTDSIYATEHPDSQNMEGLLNKAKWVLFGMDLESED